MASLLIAVIFSLLTLLEAHLTSSYQQIITYVQNRAWSVWSSIAKSYEKDTHGQNRSASGKGFRNVRSNKNCYRSSFLPRTIPEWNNLPDKIRNAPSLKNLLTDQINIKDLVQSSHYYS